MPVRPGNQVVLVTDLTTRQDHIQAAFWAAQELGARVFEIKIATPFHPNMIASQDGGDTLSSSPGALQAIYSADLVLVLHVALGSPWLHEGRRKGGRFLLVIDGPEELKRLMSPPRLKEAVTYARDLTKRSKEMRVTRPAGTDFVAKLGELNTVIQYGYADEPGAVDTWGGAHFSTWANPGSAEGTVVLQPGDCWILPYIRYFESEVRLTIERGHIRKIDGAGTDARLMRQFMKGHQTSPTDLSPYAVSHLGWGLNPNSFLDQVSQRGPAPRPFPRSPRIMLHAVSIISGVQADSGSRWLLMTKPSKVMTAMWAKDFASKVMRRSAGRHSRTIRRMCSRVLNRIVGVYPSFGVVVAIAWMKLLKKLFRSRGMSRHSPASVCARRTRGSRLREASDSIRSRYSVIHGSNTANAT